MNIVKGWLDLAKKVASPNCNARPEKQSINLLVIHNISLPPDQFGTPYVEQFFQNKLNYDAHPYFETLKGLEVSSHFFIKRDGEIIQFVSCDDRAWHAGESSFCQQDNCNDYSIGIELEGTDSIPYTDIQYQLLSELTSTIQQSYPMITADRIAGHNQIAPGRKTDPGKSFDWALYIGSITR